MITDLLQASNYPTIALIYPSLTVIKQHLVGSEEDNTIISSFKQAIIAKLETAYYKDGYETTFPMLALAMDPRFKHLSFVKPESRTQV